MFWGVKMLSGQVLDQPVLEKAGSYVGGCAAAVGCVVGSGTAVNIVFRHYAGFYAHRAQAALALEKMLESIGSYGVGGHAVVVLRVAGVGRLAVSPGLK